MGDHQRLLEFYSSRELKLIETFEEKKTIHIKNGSLSNTEKKVLKVKHDQVDKTVGMTRKRTRNGRGRYTAME